MKLFVSGRGVVVICKARELTQLIQELAREHGTLGALINARLH